MADTPILKLPQVAPGQNQKETTINSALAILEAAMNDSYVHTGKTANFTLNEDQWTRYFLHRVQGNTTPITMTVPARERLFVVSNEGTANLTITPQGGSGGNSAEVPFGKIVILVNDGTNVYAISSGVGRLQDLSDVDGTGAEDTMVLSYDESEEKWVPITIANLFDLNFTGLGDCPSSYTGAAGRLVRVNAGANGLEFFVPNLKTLSDIDPAMEPETGEILTFLDGKWTAVPAGAAELEFKDLSDVPESYEDQGGKLVRIKVDESGVEFVDPSSVGTTTFVGLTDTPADYTGDAGKFVRVNAGATGLEFTDAPPTTFLGATDTPDDYTGQAGKMVAVKDDESGVEFVDVPAGAEVAIQQDDVLIQAAATTLNFEGDGVSVSDDGAGKVTITIGAGAGGDGPFGEHTYWRVRCTTAAGANWFTTAEMDFYSEPGGTPLATGGTAISGSNYGATTAANAFDNNNATDWTCATGGVAAGTAWIGYQFAAPVSVVEFTIRAPSSAWNTEGFLEGVVEYSDDGSTWTEAWVASNTAAWSSSSEERTFNYENAPSGFLALEDTPNSYASQANKKVRVNAAANALEFVDDTFRSLSDTPSSFSGQGGRKVRVNSGATALEFVADTFRSLSDAPSSFTGHGGKKLKVNSGATAIEFVDDNITPPTTTRTGAYTCALADKDGPIPVDSAVQADITIPANADVAFPVGSTLSAIQIGVGQINFVGAAGVTVNYPASLTSKSREQFSTISAFKLSTNAWVLLGDLDSAAP